MDLETVILKTLMRPVNDFLVPSETLITKAPLLFLLVEKVEFSAILTRERSSEKWNEFDQD